jgi:hypothetical protein
LQFVEILKFKEKGSSKAHGIELITMRGVESAFSGDITSD